MSEAFAPFASRLTRGYVLLAVALIALVVLTTSILAFLLYVGTLDDAIGNDARRITERALAYERLHEPLGAYASTLAGEAGGTRVGVRVYDGEHRLLAQSGGEGVAGRFTRGVAALFGLHPSIVRVDGGSIVVAPDLAGFSRLLERYLAYVTPIGVLAVIAAWLAGRAVTRRAIAPLQEVSSALRLIAEGDFTPQPLPPGEGSLRELTMAYNEVARRLTAVTLERDRNELQMRQFIADAGHELRTPLTIVMGYLEILQRGVVDDAAGVGHVYETMLTESRRMRAAIEKLILLARLERPAAARTERFDAAALVTRVVDELLPLAGPGRVVVTALTQPCTIDADEAEVYEAVKNVVENAVRYAPDSAISIEVSRDAEGTTIAVSDRGPGMAAQDAEHAFDRFYRGGARSGEGSGLGLAIAKRAVERAGGSIALDSRPGAGTQVTISLPRV
ncbi:MAG TPA: HAMP domain-containing sensor histidine kinase [Candidatus Cybelea sp.]|nr:HAMP domain-containing sensor histidine kinase [Candidatus Cybelea sp.]